VRVETKHARGSDLTHALMLGASALLPAVVAALHVGNVADAAHDEGIVRTLGLGWTGVWRGADALVAALFLVLPLGTRAARVAFASAVVCGVAGAVLYQLARRLLAACSAEPGGPDRLGTVIAGVASMTATLSAPWLLESTSVAGSSLGALLALAPLLVAVEMQSRRQVTLLPLLACSLGLAVGYEPLVGLAAVASVGALWLMLGSARSKLTVGPSVVAAALLGLAPMALSLAGKRSTLAIMAAPLARSAGEGAPSAGLTAFLHVEVGWFGLALAAAGIALALLRKQARAAAAALVVLAVMGLGSTTLGAPFGPARFGAPVLAAMGALWVLAAVAMHAIVRAVATARVPLATASASMIVLIEVTFPVLAADDSLQRLDARGPSPAAVWGEVAFGALPARSVVLVRQPRMLTRLLAARATGELRGDLTLIPLGDITGPLASRELHLEPRLAPLWRDLLLSEAPDEWALSSLAAARPLVLPIEPRWDRALARHFVPVGLLAIFEPEPRGASDRTRALDAFAADRERLGRALKVEATPVPTARLRPAPPPPRDAGDPELVPMTATLLLDRALTFASTGERDLASRALEEALPFRPAPRTVSELARRLASATRGPLDVTDLAPR
jgi:hypothetical protein